ncbi:O-antigen ligase-like membrane protein [Flavobacterium endophyticum]|uniref:O-antigen ligase-like membrane protein n=1 Tax=Flavobacterium endophyticum TaxID=1540163 RepID=A0A495MK98_9FLAO|nr:O-antigen ligase family protein [Flavobacterium endophyticum]RKS26391.1 O-antigen ligase-like membrane protein [Flavobacterium endophyticum]
MLKNISEKLFLFLIPLLFTFPLFRENISSFFFILLSVNTLAFTFYKKSYKNFDLKSLVYTIPFFVILLFVLIRGASSEGFKHVNHSLFFLLFPIIFSLLPKEYFTKEKINFYFTILKNSCFIIAFGFVIAFLVKYDFKDFFVFKYGVPKFRDFVYYEIPFFKIHPTYYTSIVLFCTAFSFKKVLDEKKYSELIYVFVFIVITLLLLSKINIIFLGIMLIAMLLFFSPYTFKQKIAALSIFLILGVSLALLTPGVKNRFKEMYNSYNNPPTGLAYDSTNVRVSITKCSVEIAKENYLFGVGFDNLEEALSECFKSNYNSSFYENHNYLTHNYFSYILLSTGIFGFLLFLFYCFTVAKKVIRINRFLLSIAVINVFFVCLTEDYFYRHYGLFYFSLILMTYINYSKYLALNKTHK